MKHYNINNYIRYKKDVEETIKKIPKKEFHEYTRNELVTSSFLVYSLYGLSSNLNKVDSKSFLYLI